MTAGIFDAGYHFHIPATGRTGFYLDLEHPLQALGLRLIAAWQTTRGSSARAA